MNYNRQHESAAPAVTT